MKSQTAKTACFCALLLLSESCRSAPRPAPTPVRNGPQPVTIIPAPMSLVASSGSPFGLHDSSAIVVEAPDSSHAAFRVAELLAVQLRPATGFALPIAAASGATPPRGIRLRIDGAGSDLGDEGYRLNVSADSVHIAARTASGLFHGVQTLRQLLPFGIEAENSVIRMSDWQVPAVSITDRPRFAWRGSMLDVSRHFFTVDEVKQYIDILALYKFNVLHLHLADDQGWRIEIKSRPTLTEIGGATQVGPHRGGFYTQEEYSDIVRYAADRFITIVPEIDMPGHTNALLMAFPHLSCGREAPAPYRSIRVGFSAICPDSAESYAVIDDIVREISALTPGPYFHMGGDEVETLTHDQYTRFVERVQDIVERHGKRTIGWEEIWQARLRPATLVQQWRGDSARNALKQGVKLILSPAPKLYLDMKHNSATEIGLTWAALIEVRSAYDWDPAAYIAGIGETDIIGIEAPLWAETIRNITAAEFLAMPRLPAVAEVGWSAQEQRRWEDFRQRLAAHAPRWRMLGINYYASPQIPW